MEYVSFKNIRLLYLLAITAFRRHTLKATLAIFSFIGLSVVTYFFLTLTPFFAPKKVIIEGLVGQYKKDELPKQVENLVSLGLTQLTPQGEATASAAKSWSVKENGRLYEFYLRDDLVWHDGSKFTAYDLNYLFNGIETKVISPYVIQFRLKNPYAPFPTILAKPLLKGDELLGLGWYRISKAESSGNLITAIHLVPAKRQPPFQLKASADSVTVPDEIIFRFYPSLADMITAYKLGELKAMYGTLDPADLAAWKNVVYYKHTIYTSVVALFFNTKDSLLQEKNVRQALAFALPKDQFPGEQAISPIPPVSWAYNPDIKQYVFDVNHARELVAKKESSQATNPPSLGSLTLTTSPMYEAVAKQVQAAWNKLGFQTKLDSNVANQANFQVKLIRQELPADPDQYALWHSLQKETNISGYSKERIDKLLEDSREEQDKTVRLKKYADFQRFLVEDAPAIFLYYPTEGLLANKKYDSPFLRRLNGIE